MHTAPSLNLERIGTTHVKAIEALRPQTLIIPCVTHPDFSLALFLQIRNNIALTFLCARSNHGSTKDPIQIEGCQSFCAPLLVHKLCHFWKKRTPSFREHFFTLTPSPYGKSFYLILFQASCEVLCDRPSCGRRSITSPNCQAFLAQYWCA